MNVNFTIETNVVVNGDDQHLQHPQQDHGLLGVLIWWGKLFVWAVQGLLANPANPPTSLRSQPTNPPTEEEKENEEKKYWSE